MSSATLSLTMPALAMGQPERIWEKSLDQERALERFLVGIERRAYRIAQLSVRDHDEALDIVQDSMIRLARSYGQRPAEEWQPLFYRILRNRILDCQRRRKVRNRVMAFWPTRSADDDTPDPVESAPDPAGTPEDHLAGRQALAELERALADLTDRQREAFMLRNFEGLDVAQTASAMGCSQGSVKTHYFRAMQVLRDRLGEWTK